MKSFRLTGDGYEVAYNAIDRVFSVRGPDSPSGGWTSSHQNPTTSDDLVVGTSELGTTLTGAFATRDGTAIRLFALVPSDFAGPNEATATGAVIIVTDRTGSVRETVGPLQEIAVHQVSGMMQG
jgi:hypothetical protein